jgi:predicted Zn-dependent protease
LASLRSTAVVIVLLSATVFAIQLVSTADEIAIGKQAQAQVTRQTPRVGDAAVQRYLARIGRQLASHAKGARYPYSFSVADYREINAFALPGGPVWVNRGAIEAAASESQLAAVLAHEIAHISQRHAAQQLSNAMVTNLGLSFLGALLGNSGGAGAASIAARYVAGGAFLKFSRDDEREADRVGAAMMARAGWDPRGMIELMQTIREHERRDPGSVEAFFSNHPSPADRIALLGQVVPKRRTGTRDSREFQSIRARLKDLPPAKTMSRSAASARPELFDSRTFPIVSNGGRGVRERSAEGLSGGSWFRRAHRERGSGDSRAPD